LRLLFHIGTLEALDHVIAQKERIGEGLERERVLPAGDHFLVGHRTEAQDQMVIGQFSVTPASVHKDHPALQVDTLNRGLDKPGGPQEGADGERAMSRVKRAGTDLKEQRRHEKKVVAADKHDFDVRTALAERLQVSGRVNAAEAGAEDQDPSWRRL